MTVATVADVTTTLTGPTTSPQGGAVSFTATYTNNGPNPAAGVTRTATVPAGATGLVATGGTITGAGPFTITYPPVTSLASGGTASFTFTYTAPGTGTTMTTSSAVGTSTGQGNNTAPNTANVVTTLTGAADVTATISAPATAPAGSNVSFLPVITNTSGANGAANLIVRVFMGTGLTGVSASNFGTYDGVSGFVTFPTQTLGAGATFQPVIRRTVPASGSISAIVSTTSDSDPNAANNNGSAANATATVVATQVADLSIAVSGPAGATPGSVLVYSVLLSNFGPSTATGATAQLVLTGSPTGITVSSGSVAGSTVTLTVPGGTLASGASLSYTIRFTVPNNIGGTVGGTASAASTTANGDPVAANNNGTALASQVSTAIVTSTPSERCAIAGSSGSLTFTGTQNINTYYPGTANAAAGQTAVTLGIATFSGTTGQANIAVNDLVLIIQMQGAGIDQTNTNAYGSGYTTSPATEGAGRGYLDANLTAGQYEYGVVATVTGNPATSITLVSALANSYQVAVASATVGVRTFQVIRVPQYQNLTLGANLAAPAWNGDTGGVLALDVAGSLALGGFKIDMKGRGFRGGAGRQLTGATGHLRTDYRTSNTTTTNGSKGEGIAGTPRYLNPGGSAVTLLDLGITEGYPDGTTIGGGDNGRGAPGNAGGGGSDTDPVANDENTGGGGGSNGGIGGQGGNGWRSNLPYGGFGGSSFTQAAPSRLIMGGGGGAGSTNNGTVDTGNAGNNNVGGIAGNNVGTGGFTTSGAPGGGLVIARAANVSGTGIIDVSGADMNFVALNDGSGGGGAGGSVLLVSNNTAAGALTGATILANGGKGGSNTGGGEPHGPGGGGSGGVAFTSSAVNAASAFGAGANGTTAGGITYEASPGTSSDAFVRATTGFDETPFLQSGANCVNDLTTTISGPTTVGAGAASGPYTVTFTNTGLGKAGNYLTRTVTLPTGASLNTTQTNALNSTYGLTGDGLNTGSYTTTGSGPTAVTTIDFGPALNQAFNAASSFVFSFTAPAATGTPSLGSALTVSPTFGNISYTNEGANVAPNTASLALTVVNLTLSGTVFNDVNGLVGGGTINGTGTGTFGSPAVQTYVSLVSGGTVSGGTVTGGTIVATVPVATNGMYSFSSLANGLEANTTYAVVLHTTAGGSATAAVPVGYGFVGEGTAAAGDGTPNDLTVVNVGTSNVSGVNFGLDFLPSAGTATVAVTNPGGAAFYSVPATDFSGTDTDPNVTTPAGGIASVTLAAAFPTGATTVVLNGNSYTSGTWAGLTAAQRTLTTTANGNLASGQTLTVDPTATGVTSVVFSYTTTDNGGLPSVNPGSLTLNFADLTIAGTLFNDVNGLVGGGSIGGFATGTPGSTQAYVSLVNSTTNTVVATATVAANGTYSFGTANGIVAGTSYNLVLTTASGGSLTASTTSGYGFIGEGTASTGDGTPNGIVVLGAVSANVPAANFGVEKLPTAGTATQTSGNPGGTASIAITGTDFSGTDTDAQVSSPTGAISSLLITALPANATSITINGTTYSSTAALGAGVSVTTNANGSLAAGQTIAIDPISGATSIVLSYTTVDNGGLPSATPGTVTVIVVEVVAVDDLATTNLNTPVTFAVAGNDLANGGEPIAPGTIDLNPNTAGIQTSITTGQGTFTTVGAPVGSVTFTPTSPTFSGTATTPYVIGNTATPSAISNQADLVVTVRPPVPVDLSVIISGAPSPVLAGGTVTFTATTTNNSTTTASPNTVSTVQLPTGLSAATLQVNSLPGTVSGSNINFAGGTYNTTTGLLTLTTATLTAGQASATTVSFPAPATGPVVATASTGNGAPDPTPANNTATANVPVTPQFDLVTTLDGPATVVQGDLATFTLTSHNNGPSPVPNAVQTAQFPTGLSGVFVTNGGYYNATGASQTVYIVNGQTTTTNPGGGATAYAVPAGGVLFPPVALANGQTVTNSVSFAAPAANFSPSAVISPNTSGAGDTNTANNTAFLNGAAVSTPVLVTAPTAAVANLFVTLAGPANVTPGQTGVTYTLTQGNNGPNPAANVATQVSLPTGLNAGSLTVGGVTGTTVGNNTTFVLPGGTATYSSVTGLLALPVVASQASAASTSLSIVLTAPLAGPSYNLTASTAATTTDPVPADNVASLMTNLTPSTDVATTITGPATATAGQTVTYQVTTTNTTTAAAATRVAQVVTLPAGLSASSLRLGGLLGTLGGTVISFADGSTYDVTSGILTLPVLATLPGGTSQVTSISFPAPGNLPSMAPAVRVTSLSPDGVLTNNASTTTTTLSPLADVVVAVTGPANAIIGNPVTYVVTTTNNGPSSAASQTTTVQLPTGLSGVVVHDNSGAVVSGAYNATTGIVTLPTVTNQLPGQTNAQTGTITFAAPNTPRLDVAGVASVTNATGDPNLSNNVATAVTTLGAANPTTADVAVTLVPDVTTQTAGSPVVYTLTTQNNTAANPASNVTRAVTLPAGLSTTTLALNGTTSSSQTGNVITYVGGPNNGATYDVTTGVLTLPAIASLVNGTPVLTTITVTTADVNPLVASATVAANNTDPNLANNTAQATNVAITPRLDVFTSVTGPASAALSSPVTYSVVTGNNGPSNALGLVQTVTLPAGATGITAPAGATIVGTIAGTTVTYTVPSLAPGSSVTNLISFTAPATGTGYTIAATVPTTNDATPANNSSSAATATPNVAPVARDVVNTAQTPEGNTAGALPISSLSATDANGNGTLVSYTILALPPATQGVLYVFNGATNVLLNTTNFPGLVLTPAQAAQLQFDPAPGFVGTVVFNYVATDNGNGNPAAALTSDAARYTIQVGQDNPSLYTNTVRTGTPAYTVGQAISNVFDPNGGKYTSAGLVDNGTSGNGLTSAVLAGGSTLPAGTAINPVTGQIYVTNPAQLVPGTYTVNVTTTDIYGGTTTQPVTFSIGLRPLPVELLAFAATAVNNRDSKLTWRTASERNNDHFDIERSLTGRDFVKFAEVDGQGNTQSPTDYALTDANATKLGATVYYRLKQVDTDSTVAYSPVQTVRFTKGSQPTIALFPNPAKEAATLDLSALPTGSYTVSLTDLTGRLVRTLTLEAGLTHNVVVQDLASGLYLLTVQGTADNAGLRFTERLTKE